MLARNCCFPVWNESPAEGACAGEFGVGGSECSTFLGQNSERASLIPGPPRVLTSGLLL